MRAAGATNPGLQRDVNEDRVHVDVQRGVFAVVDGMGGQAAGGRAADIAMSMLKTRLERETGRVADRVREAITIANNEVHRAAGTRAEWNGMACVLTVVVIDDGHATVGHVGDTRLYKLRDGHLEKATRDHSPIGEREDAAEISERDAMRHPRRNEVYRDVGSEPHQPDDPDFIDILEIPWEPDAALLLCSDGLTDLVDSSAIQQIAGRLAGRPQQVVDALIDSANAAGGKDNVSVVYVENERFASSQPVITRRLNTERGGSRQRGVRLAIVALLAAVIGVSVWRLWPIWPWPYGNPLDAFAVVPMAPSEGSTLVVRPGDSIAAAIRRARPGSQVVVEPGEYHETLELKTGVRVLSRVPRGATIRLTGAASETDPAVVADGVTGAELAGFRIVGDAATPLGTGVLVKQSELVIADVEITGAAQAAIRIDRPSRASVVASDIHDNPGAALAVEAGASPRIAHNVFMRNGMSERVHASFLIENGADPRFSGNVFHGVGRDAFARLSDGARAALGRDNFFVDAPEPRPAAPPPSTPRGGRGR